MQVSPVKLIDESLFNLISTSESVNDVVDNKISIKITTRNNVLAVIWVVYYPPLSFVTRLNGISFVLLKTLSHRLRLSGG